MAHSQLFLLLLCSLSALSLVVAQPAAALYRINANGPAFTDSSERDWSADNYFVVPGRTYSVTDEPVDVTGPGVSDKLLYETERWRDDMEYSFPVANGFYTVILHFAEMYNKTDEPGLRQFDIELEGIAVKENFDITVAAGAPYKAVVLEFPGIEVMDNWLTLTFGKKIQNPKINGIEILEGSLAPTPTNSPPPVPPPPMPQSPLAEIRINVGSSSSVFDADGNEWIPDTFFTGGKAYQVNRTISNVQDDLLQPVYTSERYANSNAGESTINYEIPVLDGTFRVMLLFAEIFDQINDMNERVFDVSFEGLPLIENLNIFQETKGIDIAYDVERIVEVKDGFLSIELTSVTQNCKLNGIVVFPEGNVSPHYAHAVPHLMGGAYFAIANEGEMTAVVQVDGSGSHTHLPGAKLERWTWSIVGLGTLGEGETAQLIIPIGEWQLDLEVEDTFENSASDSTFVTVRQYGFPKLTTVTPFSGDVSGGETLTLIGNFLSDVLVVNIGTVQRTGNEITILSETQIQIVTPPVGQPTKVGISVESLDGKSNSIEFEFIDVTLPPVAWDSGVVDDIDGPTTLAFGPDGRLYVGTGNGELVRLTLDENYNVIERYTSNAIQDSETSDRTILGIAFDPNDTKQHPDVYVSHCWLFHKQDVSYNGKVSKLSGPLLDQFTNIVTGIPISDHDHGVNGIEFGDDGELYIQNGGNTNAGIPGKLSSREQQDEDWFSAATLVARGVGTQDFDGDLTYDNNGIQKGGWSVEVFAPGMRNPFDIVLHSNGMLYGTDNGPNKKFGNESVSCTEKADDPSAGDELNLIVQGNYYGHPNRLRGNEDPRQCTYYAPNDVHEDHTAPIAKLPSSTNGICEFQTEHFGGQLRGQLIVGKWKNELRIVKLSPDGLSTVSGLSAFPPLLVDQGGLDVTQGPDGTLFVAGYGHNINKIFYHKPIESVAAPGLKIKSVFPRRGPRRGGSTLSIFCENLNVNGALSVKVGGNDCLNPVASGSVITCMIPSGAGKVDVVVTTGINTADSFEGGYRYTNALSEPVWIDLEEDESYSKRHECSFVQAGDKFYLFGGRENSTRLDIYNYGSNTWSIGAPCPLAFNHFQAIEYEGLIWVIGSFKTNNYPMEALTEDVYVFDPAKNIWMKGPAIPEARRRGSGGLQVYNDKFYLIGGNTMGHNSGFVSWMDEYDPRTGQWRQLPNAPRARDHFHAVVIGDRLYAAGGRRTANDQNNVFGDVIPEVDVFDFGSETWLPPSTAENLPEPRAAAATAVFDGKVILAGGETETSSLAYDKVHELDPASGKWKELASLNHARHGTQAITSGRGVYVAAGSWKKGGGNQHNMEVYNQNLPAGVASEAGSLSALSSIDVIVGTPTTMTIQHQGDGNQGIFVTAIMLEGPNFVITSSISPPLLIPKGGSLDVIIEYTGTLNNEMGLLVLEHSGDEMLLVDLEGSATIVSTSIPITTTSTESTTFTATATPITTTTTESTTITATSTLSDLDIVDFVIVNVLTDIDIGSANGCTGCLTSSTLMSIRAVPRGMVGSIELILTGPESESVKRLENVAPYSLWGDKSGIYNGKTLPAGAYTVRAIAFSQSGGLGEAGVEASADFTVV